MSVHAKMKTHISKTAQRLEDEVESRPWHGWPGIIAWRWVGRANKLDINFFGHKLGASANMIYWYDAASFPRRHGTSARGAPLDAIDASRTQVHEHPLVRDFWRRLRFTDDVVLRQKTPLPHGHPKFGRRGGRLARDPGDWYCHVDHGFGPQFLAGFSIVVVFWEVVGS